MHAYWSIVVAMTTQGVIGRDNQLPWKLPGDLKRFKDVTMGRPIVMGRKTFESIGRVLPGRRNIVVTRDPSGFLSRHGSLPILNGASLEAVADLGALLSSPPSDGENFLIGGGELFGVGLPYARKLYVTWVEKDIPGDAYFPAWNSEAYRATEIAEYSDPLPHRFVDYELK